MIHFPKHPKHWRGMYHMAIRRRKLKSGCSFEVYWKDPFTNKTAGKSFPTLSDARLYETEIKRKMQIARKLNKKDMLRPSPVYIEQAEGDGFDTFRKKCLALYNDERVRTADIFDYVMKTLDIPTRFKDVVATVVLSRRGRAIPKKLRFEVLQRDNFTCKYCHAEGSESKLHVDHIIPVTRGGLTEARNLQTLCEACNLGKSDSPLELNA
jgi:hypothetical protein